MHQKLAHKGRASSFLESAPVLPTARHPPFAPKNTPFLHRLIHLLCLCCAVPGRTPATPLPSAMSQRETEPSQAGDPACRMPPPAPPDAGGSPNDPSVDGSPAPASGAQDLPAASAPSGDCGAVDPSSSAPPLKPTKTWKGSAEAVARRDGQHHVTGLRVRNCCCPFPECRDIMWRYASINDKEM